MITLKDKYPQSMKTISELFYKRNYMKILMRNLTKLLRKISNLNKKKMYLFHRAI